MNGSMQVGSSIDYFYDFMNEHIHYDIIADVHGRFDKLTSLMECLGYCWDGAGFTPPAGHRALFLGDLMDSKPGYPYPGGVSATLKAVKTMCERGDALCIMGNHEFNAILFHTYDPDGKPLRVHSDKNVQMHKGTLDDFPDYADASSEWHTVWLPWIKSLPFAIDLGGIRAVHACWQPKFLERLNGKSLLDDSFLFATADPSTPEWEAIEIVLKGIEVPLPTGAYFTDHSGTKREQFRARWWENPATDILCSELVFPTNDQIPSVPIATAAQEMFSPYPSDDCPVFFGHYLKPGSSNIQPERHNVACLDYSAATNGPLVGYRWKGESSILPENFVCSSS